MISTGTAEDGAGISWKVFRIFGGHHHGLNNLYSLGNLDSFFTAGGNHNGRYTATIQIADTELAIVKENRDWENWDWETDSGPITTSSPFRYAMLNFNVYEDATVLRQESRRQGEWAEGLQLADMFYYTVASGSILDQNGVALSKGADNAATLAQMERPEDALRDVQFQTRDGWTECCQGSNWRTYRTELSKMECRKNGQSGRSRMNSIPSMERAQRRNAIAAINSGKALWRRTQHFHGNDRVRSGLCKRCRYKRYQVRLLILPNQRFSTMKSPKHWMRMATILR